MALGDGSHRVQHWQSVQQGSCLMQQWAGGQRGTSVWHKGPPLGDAGVSEVVMEAIREWGQAGSGACGVGAGRRGRREAHGWEAGPWWGGCVAQRWRGAYRTGLVLAQDGANASSAHLAFQLVILRPSVFAHCDRCM